MNVHEYVITSYLINAFNIVRLVMSKIYTLFRKRISNMRQSLLQIPFLCFLLNIIVRSMIQSDNWFPPHII